MSIKASIKKSHLVRSFVLPQVDRLVARRMKTGVLGKLKKSQKATIAELKKSQKAAKKQKLTIAKHISTIHRQRSQLKKLTNFISGMATHSWSDPAISEDLLALFSAQPSLATSMAFSLMDNSETEQLGLLTMLKNQHHRQMYTFACTLADRCPEEYLVANGFRAAAESYAITGNPKALKLVKQFLASEDQSGPNTVRQSQYMGAMRTALFLHNFDLMAAVLRQAPTPDSEAEVTRGSYKQLYLQAVDWCAEKDNVLPKAKKNETVKIGVLGYRAPLKPSTNIGDYVQTIAMMGLVARNLSEESKLDGDGDEVFKRVQSMVTTREEVTERAPSDLVWIDRDDPSTAPSGGLIWTPLNGWFMHPPSANNYNFPFADNVRPFFLGMHINQPQMLTSEAVAYLKKYEPIGARDYHTAELLMANGVDAFFSGCPTLSLDEIFGQKPSEERSGGHYRGAHAPLSGLKSTVTELIHMAPAMPTWSRADGLEKAWSYLEQYSTAQSVETPLLHCYLPCRALGTPVEFNNKKRTTDPRFEGLIDITDRGRNTLVTRLKNNVDAMLSLVFEGASEAEVYQAWKDRNTAGVAEIRARLDSRSSAAPESTNLSFLSDLSRKTFLGGKESPAPDPDHAGPDVVFCYDANFERPTYVTVRSILANTSSAVRFTLLTRELEQHHIEALSAEFPEATFVWFDVARVQFEDLKLLHHTTVSTMDRVILPEILDYAKRIVYLDIDIAVLGDIAQLHRVDMQGHGIGARQTIFPSWSSGFGLCNIIEKQLNPDQLSLFRKQFLYKNSMEFDCFNAGVLVMDLDVLRTQNFTPMMMQLTNDYGINDQFAINLFTSGEFAHLDASWNHFATQEWIEAPNLVHYTGYIKPWAKERCPKTNLWRQYVQASDQIAFEPAISKAWSR